MFYPKTLQKTADLSAVSLEEALPSIIGGIRRAEKAYDIVTGGSDQKPEAAMPTPTYVKQEGMMYPKTITHLPPQNMVQAYVPVYLPPTVPGVFGNA